MLHVPRHLQRRRTPLVWRMFTQLVAVSTLGGRYHDTVDFADRLVLRTAAAPKPASADDRRERLVAAWEVALREAPDEPVCHYALSAALRHNGQFERAGEVIGAAVARFPDDLGTTIEAARVAERRGDIEAALEHWRKAAGRPRARAMWATGAAYGMVTLGRFDEADALIAKARRAHPRHSGLMAAECTLASAREDWPKAIALWSDFYRRFPKYPQAWELLGRAIHSGKLSEIDQPSRFVTEVAVKADVGRVEDEATRELLLGFESLGENCEFGLVQRRFGAEPTDLLRWSIVWVEFLIEALEQDFAGFGEPEYTELVVLADREFFIQDKRWYLGRHTFRFEGQTTHDELFPRTCERTTALKAQFLANLAGAKRTYVYCSAGLTREALDALHAGLRRYGQNRILAVQPAAPTAGVPFRGRPGEAIRIAPGRYVGFVSHRGIGPDKTWSIAFDEWIAICRQANAMAAEDAPALAGG